MLCRPWIVCKTLQSRIAGFKTDAAGQVAIIFAIASMGLLVATGAGIDLARAYSARQKLSEIAALACQFSNRPSIAQTASSTYTGSNGFQTYVNAVNAFATSSLVSQSWSWSTPTGPGGTTGAYFTATAASGAATSPTNASVQMSVNVPTSIMQLVHVNQIPVHAAINCQPAAASPQIVNAGYVVQEGFETPCSHVCYQTTNGTSTTSHASLNAVPTQTFPTASNYTGSSGYKWYVMGYCLETDMAGTTNATVPEGSHAAELDCDNGSYSAGNSSISTNVYLATGTYELRYNYRARVDYPDYDPTYICATTASDLSWANDTNYVHIIPTSQTRTNQINVYLDLNTNGTAPLHTTIDGTQHLAGSNLIDMCVYSPTWIERSVRITVNTPAFYWLSFAADGASDSFGGQLDNIRVCQNKCPGTPQDNFPSDWLAANNGGSSKVLFEDTFDLPAYVANFSTWDANNGNLNLSTGTNVTTGCLGLFYLSPPGWPCQTVSGWATAPYNEISYIVMGAYQGSQYIGLDGYNGYSTGSASRNRLISRPFLLDPGYYQVSYAYISDVDFSGAGLYGTNCYTAPGSGSIFAASYPGLRGNVRYYGSQVDDGATEIVGVFMSNGQLVSTPITGGLLGSTTSYNNPDGTVSSTPTVPPDAVTWSNYNPNVVNPVLDVCGYVDSFRWVPRTASVKITKPGLYWLTFSANGSVADGNSGGIDDVKLTALGSLYSSAPSSGLTTIPVPAPQPDTSYTNSGVFNGFSIVADPQTPPGGP